MTTIQITYTNCNNGKQESVTVEASNPFVASHTVYAHLKENNGYIVSYRIETPNAHAGSSEFCQNADADYYEVIENILDQMV